MTIHNLPANAISARYGNNEILHGLDLAVPPGKITVIRFQGDVPASLPRMGAEGDVLLNGKQMHKTPPKELPSALGPRPRSPIEPEDTTVADLVSRGRHPHQTLFSRWGRKDNVAIYAVLAATRLTHLADRLVNKLSGDQRHRFWIAMALAQETEVLLVDELTVFLDISHEVEVLNLLTDLNHKSGTTIVMMIHQPAAHFSRHPASI